MVEKQETLQAEVEALRSQILLLETERDSLMQHYQELEEQRQWFNVLVENSADFISISGLDGTIRYLNQAGRSIVGLAPDADLSHFRMNEFFFTEDEPFIVSTVMPTLRQNNRWHGDFRVRHVQTGRAIDTDHNVFALPSSKTGEPIGIVTVCRNITEHKAKDELQQKLVAVIENSSDFIGIADPDGKVIYLNNAGRKMIGLESDEEVFSSMIQSYTTPEDQEFVEQHILPEFVATDRWEGEFRFRHAKTGEAIPVSYKLFTVRDQTTNELIALATVSRDISEQQEREQRLRTFFALTENAPDGVVVASLDGSISYVNEEFKALTAYSESMLDMHISQLFDGTEEQYGVIFDTTFEHGYWQGVWPIVRDDGSIFSGYMSSFLIRDEAGFAFALGFIVRDVSDKIQAERERAALQEQVIEAQRAAIRELGTPLIPLADKIVAMPLVGTIDTSRSQLIMETLLEGCSQLQAEVVILDITGVRVIDTQVADGLIRTARAASLLGCEVIITGIGPEVAQTLVQLGVDLGAIVTRSNLQSGIVYALQKRKISFFN
jgi:rsbT co-antagonist protein RsbR